MFGFFESEEKKEIKTHLRHLVRLAKADGVLESSIVNGYEALAQNNAENSLAHFSLAYAINSQNSDALEGLQRAQVLTEVVGLIAQADADKKQGDFIAAKDDTGSVSVMTISYVSI